MRALVPAVVALALLAPLAPAAADAPASPADAWRAVKAALAAGDLPAAKARYDADLATGADAAPHAARVLDEAFQRLAGAGNPAAARYKADAQLVDKALYAVASANVDAALAAGDLPKAEAWFGLLAAKFAKAEELPHAKAAFGNLTAGSAPEARGVLAAEYRDLILAKVAKEIGEVAGLLGSAPVKAAEEAAEANGYFLSVDADARERLGEEGHAAVRAALASLLAATLDGDASGVETSSEVALTLLGRYALLAADPSKADAFAQYAALLKEKNPAGARDVFVAAFAWDASEHARGAAERVAGSLDDAEAAAKGGDDAGYEVARQLAEKGALAVAIDVTRALYAAGRVDEGAAWLRVPAAKFRWLDQPPEGVAGAGAAAAANRADAATLDLLARDFDAKLLAKVQEEIIETFETWGTTAAPGKAAEAVGYYRPLAADVAARLGAAPSEEVARALDALLAAAIAGDRVAAEAAATEADRLLAWYASDGEPPSDFARLVQTLKGRIDFVVEEYHGHFEALAAGDEKEAGIELGEAKAFLAGAKKLLLDNRATFDAIDADEVPDALAGMDAMGEVLDALGPLADLEARAKDVLAILDGFVSASPPDGPDEAPVPAVRIVLGDARADGPFRVPVSLVGLPETGSAFQLKVRFDPTLLQADGVEVLFGDVKSSRIENAQGHVTFNGAATGAAQATQRVAEISFTPKAPGGGGTQLTVEVEDLTDADGKPLAAGPVEGGLVTLAAGALPRGGSEDATTPWPAALALAGVLAIAALARRRREG